MKNDKEIRVRAYAAADVHVRSNDDGSDSRIIEGYAIVFNQLSLPLWLNYEGEEFYEIIAPEAVTRELLDKCDIKLTMFHDMTRILARSKQGKGTLSYDIDDYGVKFRAEMPHTVVGDEALELVKLGNIDGCSFMFATKYGNSEYVECKSEGGKTVFTVRKISNIYDFTLTPDPAYPDTECSARALVMETEKPCDNAAQVAEMRAEAKRKMI